MNKEEFDHGIRAAGGVLDVVEVLVIESQAAHASVPGDLPPEAQRSIEVDIAVFEDPDGAKADLLDGAIGEASMFQMQHGFYVDGVSVSTAILPNGWQDRLVRYDTPATNEVVAWCLELHDLWVSKALAGRPKDLEFCGAFLRGGLVDSDVLLQRISDVDSVDTSVRQNAINLIGR
jgi:hypothetical protein